MDLEDVSMGCLLRYIYTGRENCTFSKKKKPALRSDILRDEMVLETIRLYFEADPQRIFEVIKRVIRQRKMFRMHEVILILAYITAKATNKSISSLIYKDIAELLPDQQDFLLFIKYINKIKAGDPFGRHQSSGPKGFGAGLRKCTSRWYNSKTNLEFADMIGKHRKLHKWGHKDIIRMCHVKFSDAEKNTLVMATFQRGVKVRPLLKREISGRTNDDDDFDNNDVSDDEIEMENVNVDENATRNQNDNENENVNENEKLGLKRLSNIIKLKICEDPEKAVSLIKTHNFDIDYVPTHLLEKSASNVWLALLPKFTYFDFLKYLPTLNDTQLLSNTKPQEDLIKAVTKMACNNTLIQNSNVHPIHIFCVKRFYELKQRFNDAIKEEHHTKKMEKYKIEPNPHIIKKLTNAFNFSFSTNNKVGVRVLVTIDLRKGNQKKSVYGMHNVYCMEASVIFATAFVKREKGTSLYTFTDDINRLDRITLQKVDSYDKIFNDCSKNMRDKTRALLDLPIITAGNTKYDAFITIVDSVARFHRNNQFPTVNLNTYRQNVNKKAKYILLNLARRNPDIEDKPDGVLEINGLDMANTANIIDSFLRHDFF